MPAVWRLVQGAHGPPTHRSVMRRLYAVLVSALSLTVASACSDDDPQKGDTTNTDTAEVADTEPDTTPDTEPDTTPDTEPDTTPDTTPDTEPDTAPDTTPDTEPDTTPDIEETTPDTEDTSETDTSGPAVLTIAKGDDCGVLVPYETPALPFEDNGTTVGLSDDYIYTTGVACGGVGSALWGDASPDVVYRITPEVSGVYNIELRPAAGYDPALMVTDKCPPIGEDGFLGMTCHAVSDQGTEGSPELMRMPMIAGQTYFLLVDGWNNNIAVSGTFTFKVSLGEDCADDLDNDNNGQTDCNDVQCAGDPLCNESTYTNGCRNQSDDDGDGATDCADPDCAGSDACNEATYANGCRNNQDDDGDGATDCADANCAGLNACNESTYTNGCINSQDDDGDGLTDCADANCFGTPTCNEANYAEGCTNTSDDDGDGRTDCADPDCGASPNCIGTGETCAEPLVLVEGAPTNGTTVGRVNDYGTSATTCLVKSSSTSFGAGAPDAVYSFTPNVTGRYDIRVTASFDLGLTLTTDCAFGAGSTCFGSERGLQSDGERIVAQLTGGTTYFVIVDGWSNTNPANTGTFVITAKLASSAEVETLCENRLDEEGDGQTDCADNDCAFDLAACTEAGKCADGIDNDADGRTDCADTECRIAPIVCPRPTADNCGTPAVATTTAPATFNTCGFDIDFTLSGVTGCIAGSTGAPDAVTRFTATEAGSYWVELVGTSPYDSILNIVRSATCPQTVAACAASRDTSSATEAVAIALAANETIHIITTGDGSASSYCGATQLRVSLLPPENCSNTADDDRDGQTDCNDADCRNSRSCNEYINGDDACEDTLDNDNDGRTDCADLDCRANVELCPSPAGDNCFNPVVVGALPWFQDFDTCTMANDFRVLDQGGCQGTTTTGTAQDVVAKFIVPADGDYRIAFDTSIDGSTFDSILNVVKDAECPASPIDECVIGSDQGNPERGTIENALAGETYWIFADGWSTACSNGRLSVVQLDDEVCTDGVDNDGDTLTDCLDTTDCGQAPTCNESVNGDTACSDTIDNDNDGTTDCFDRDCRTNAACPGGVPGGSCGNPFSVTTANFTATVNTCDYENDFTYTSGVGCRGSTTNTARDLVLDFEPPAPGNYRVTFNASPSFDSVINVVKNGECPASPVAACTQGVDGGNPERVDITAAAGDYFYIIVDGYSSACGAGTVTIVQLAAEVCDDNVDNDGDSRTDCFDPECFGVGTCPAAPPGSTCAAAIPLTVGTPLNGTTVGGNNSYSVADTATCPADLLIGTSTGAGNDVSYVFTAPAAGSYTFTVNGTWDTVLTLVSDCSTLPNTCIGSADLTVGEPETRTATLTQGQVVYVIVDGYSALSSGTYTVSVTGP